MGIPGATTPISAPTISSVTPGDGQNTISWGTVSGATAYNLYWKTTTGVDKTSTKLSNVTSPYSHTGLTNGVEIFYVVTAEDDVTESDESTEDSGTPAAGTPAGNPSITAYPVLAKNYRDNFEFQRRVSEIVNSTRAGKLNNWGEVTLTANATTTVISDFRIGAFSVVHLMPMTANAKTAIANVYFNDPDEGSITINHASSANTDQDFRYTVFA